MPIRLWNTNLKVRLFGEALFNMLFWMYFPFITVYFGAALGNHIAGILMTVPPIFSIVGSLLGGALADRLGRRPVMLLGASLQTVMFALFALSPSHWTDYAAFIGIGFGAIYRPASSAMVADLVPVQERRQVFATFTTANNLGPCLDRLSVPFSFSAPARAPVVLFIRIAGLFHLDLLHCSGNLTGFSEQSGAI